jgi:ADP-ribose pyrophosphatase
LKRPAHRPVGGAHAIRARRFGSGYTPPAIGDAPPAVARPDVGATFAAAGSPTTAARTTRMPHDAPTGVLYRGKKFAVERRKVKLPDGRTPVYDLVVHGGAAVVLAFPTPTEVLLVHQYRPAVGRRLWELPAGTIEEGEDPRPCAARELEEECGVRAGRLVKLCEYFPSPGVMTERMHLYAATHLKAGRQRLDEHESLKVHRVKLSRAYRWAASGKIEDGKTLVGLLVWKLKRG